MTTPERYIMPVDEDGNIHLTKELIQRARWKLGDKLTWKWEDEHHIELRKADDDQ